MRAERTADAAPGAPTGPMLKTLSERLCIETQGREVMSKLVHDLTAEAFRLNLYGAPAERVEKANGAQLEAPKQVPNG